MCFCESVDHHNVTERSFKKRGRKKRGESSRARTTHLLFGGCSFAKCVSPRTNTHDVNSRTWYVGICKSEAETHHVEEPVTQRSLTSHNRDKNALAFRLNWNKITSLHRGCRYHRFSQRCVCLSEEVVGAQEVECDCRWCSRCARLRAVLHAN